MNHRKTSRFLALLLAAAACFPPAGSGQSGAPKKAAPPAAQPQAPASAAAIEQARKLYQSGVEAEEAEAWNTAFAFFSEAAEMEPSNAEYAARRERAKFRLVQQHVDAAELANVQGRLDDARDELRLALKLDPKYRIAQERLAQLQARSAQPTGRKSEYEATPIRLAPRPGKRAFDYRGNTIGAYDELARQFGLSASYDSELSSRQLRFRIPAEDFKTAVSLLQQQTDTFIRPLDDKVFLVVADTPEKRRQYAERVTRTVELASSTSADEMNEIRNMVRDIAGIANPQLVVGSRQIVLRGERQAVALAVELVREMERARGELMLEVEFLEVDRNRARTLGITPPTSGQIFTLSPADVREAQQSTEALLRVIQRVFGQTGTGNLSQEELAARLASGQVGVASLLPPLIAFGGGKTIFLTTLPGAAADFSETLGLVQRARRMMLRAEDGMPATFFVGDRFPISFSVLSSGLASTETIPGIKKTEFPTDLGPLSVAIADFNGDGKPDIVTANSGSNTISVLLNDGTGNFGTKTDVVVGSSPRAVVAKDFNNDGKVDLAVAVASSTSNTVEILLGNGDGTFTLGSSLAAGVMPVALALGDFNGDGITDVAVANAGDNTVFIYLGTGDGGFNFSEGLFTGVSPSGIAVSEFNGDGKPDLVVSNSGDNSLSVFVNAGGGLFNPGVSLATGLNPVGIITGNFDADSNEDIVTVNKGANTVSEFTSNGDGTFSVRRDFVVGTQPAALVSGDFTGDGRTDIAVANSGANTITILAGLGDGTFIGADFTAPSAPFALATGDLDADGRLDLVSANRDANTVTAYLNTTTVVTTSASPQQAYPAVQFEDIGVKARATPRLHANGEVTLQLQFEIRSFAPNRFNGIPVITNRTVEQTIRVREDEPAILAGILQQSTERSASGWPGMGAAPVLGQTVGKKSSQQNETELIVVVTPRRIRLAPRKDRSIYAGRGEAAPSGGGAERPPQ